MAVHQKNPSFAEIQRQAIANSVQSSMENISGGAKSSAESSDSAKSTVEEPEKKSEPQTPVEKPAETAPDIKTVTTESASGERKRKDVLIGIHVTDDERNELRQMFCSNGFSLATAYRAAMTYLRQDIELGKAYITSNGEILRK